MRKNELQKREIPKLERRKALEDAAPIVYIRHSVLGKYNIHIIQYCLIVFLIRVSTKHEYCSIRKGQIANFLAIPDNTFSYHLNELKKLKFLEDEKGKGIKIINEQSKHDLNPYLGLSGTYNLLDYKLLEKLQVTHLQYCLLHSLFVTKHYSENIERTSLQTIAKKLNASRTGIDKAIKILANRIFLIKGIGSNVTLSKEILTDFTNLHKHWKTQISSTGNKHKGYEEGTSRDHDTL